MPDNPARWTLADIDRRLAAVAAHIARERREGRPPHQLAARWKCVDRLLDRRLRRMVEGEVA